MIVLNTLAVGQSTDSVVTPSTGSTVSFHLTPSQAPCRRVRAVASALVGILAWTVATSARADDLGVIGPVYPIAEPNFLEWIVARLREKEASGELQRLQDAARQRAIERVNNPSPLAGITASDRARTFYFDPTVTLSRNLFTPGGHLMFAAGTRKNPLEVVSLSKLLLFFDARDTAQVERARVLIDYYRGHVKPILVGGSYIKLMQAWHIPVYYDQSGVLTRRLGIAHVPAIVSQEGLRLRIDELGAPR